jgi:hypothetical protein
MAYRTAEMLQLDADATLAVAIATRCALTDVEEDADTENDAVFTTLAAAAIVEDEAAVNEPIAYRTALNAAVDAAVKVTAPSVTP